MITISRMSTPDDIRDIVMNDGQLSLPFDEPFSVSDQPELWLPRDIWFRFTQRMVSFFQEDRRIEYKRTPKIDWDSYSSYLSAFSNTPDGGVLCFGVDDKGSLIGAKCLSSQQLNRLETCYLTNCPGAKPEFKRVPITADHGDDFLVLIYIPYVGKLVETNKGEAWIRYGDSKHKMAEEEKRDFRSTRQEVAYELERSSYRYPNDFDRRILHDFCEEFRSRENRSTWTNEEILTDRRLLEISGDEYFPKNALVLFAATDPNRAIPGCRVRVQRFESDTEGHGLSYNPIRDSFCEGNIVKLITVASVRIEEALHNVTWLNSEGKFVTTSEYPKWAWYEALVNACVHRSYSYSGTDITVNIFSDRMEIERPGSFVPPVNEQKIYHTRSSRNHHLMEAMRVLGYVQMAREGTRRIRESMKEFNLPEPEFKQEVLHGVVVKGKRCIRPPR